MQIEENEVRLVRFDCSDGPVRILGHGDDAVTRVVLDKIFERDRQLAVVFDDEDLEHPRASRHFAEIPPGKSVTWMLAHIERAANAW